MLALLANLFMGHHEKLWIRNFDNSQLLFYRRYVDDTFCVFNSEIQAMSFFEYINSQHPTMEKEVEKKIPFLDILIDISQDRVVTSMQLVALTMAVVLPKHVCNKKKSCFL